MAVQARPLPLRLRFRTVDVFSTRQFGGNQLAVVLDPHCHLNTAQMTRIAREFNFAETSFVRPRGTLLANDQEGDLAREGDTPDSHDGFDFAVRIFTPAAEVPFAGHPNIGTAFALATWGDLDSEYGPVSSDNSAGKAAKEELLFEEKAGRVRVALSWAAGETKELESAELTAPQLFERRKGAADAVSVAAVAAMAGLAPEEIDTTRHEPAVCSCGLAFLLVEVVSRAALKRARPNAAAFEEHLAGAATGIHLYWREGDAGRAAETGIDVHARMFAPEFGVRPFFLRGMLVGLSLSDSSFFLVPPVRVDAVVPC
jgi:trans-2,3-dihydro-3-hydroxyanthranilate isomerase